MSSEESHRLGGGELVLRHSARATRLRLRVDPRRRRVLLTIPGRMSPRRALAWAAQHELWVERQLADLPRAQPLGHGAILAFQGRPHRIVHDPGAPRRVERREDAIIVGGPNEGFAPRMLRWFKHEALSLLAQETREFCALAGVEASRVSVGDPVSRWGSCSASGRIRYSWRLILAPDFVRRATVAHEVAHLVHLHHGAAFHALVEQLLGASPKAARDWLRKHGSALHRIGI